MRELDADCKAQDFAVLSDRASVVREARDPPG
jgi:hypothetical protein